MGEETGFVLSKRTEDVIHWTNLAEEIPRVWFDARKFWVLLWLPSKPGRSSLSCYWLGMKVKKSWECLGDGKYRWETLWEQRGIKRGVRKDLDELQPVSCTQDTDLTEAPPVGWVWEGRAISWVGKVLLVLYSGACTNRHLGGLCWWIS